MGLLYVKIHDDDWFAGKMTQIQFEALAQKCNWTNTKTMLSKQPYYLALQKRELKERARIVQLAKNSWNTEAVINISRNMLEGDSLKYSLQWAFAQAYYSIFSMTSAYFVAAGFTEKSHTSVLKKFAELCLSNKYPESIGFLATGVPNYEYVKLSPQKLSASSFYDPNNPGVIDAQISQFLNTTRNIELKDKLYDLKLRTRTGNPKKSFNKSDKKHASDKIGPTSILNLLYRKRIKANYKDIDTFMAESMEPFKLYDSLIKIVACVNGVHELFINRLLGVNIVESYLASNKCQNYEFLEMRKSI